MWGYVFVGMDWTFALCGLVLMCSLRYVTTSAEFESHRAYGERVGFPRVFAHRCRAGGACPQEHGHHN